MPQEGGWILNSYENFERDFLADLVKPGMGEERYFQHQQLADKYGIPEAHVRALLVAWDAQGFIAVRCWDGERLRPCRQWKQTDDMFFNTVAGGYVRVRLLAAGAAWVADFPARPIGFIPKWHLMGKHSRRQPQGVEMGKYDPLRRYLLRTSAKPVMLTFSQVEEIIGGELPPSAFTYGSWWSNDKSHIQAAAWMSAKRRVDSVDIERRTVTFGATR